MITTTLARIRAHNPCRHSWRVLLAALGKTDADDEPLPLVTILDICGLNDALWALRTMPEYDALWRHLAVDYAERVEHLLRDKRSREALRVARNYASGLATELALRIAYNNARVAAADASVEASSEGGDDVVNVSAADAAAEASCDYTPGAYAAACTGEHVRAARGVAWQEELGAQAERLRAICTAGVWTPLHSSDYSLPSP
jgi:hypothetical protein